MLFGPTSQSSHCSIHDQALFPFHRRVAGMASSRSCLAWLATLPVLMVGWLLLPFGVLTRRRATVRGWRDSVTLQQPLAVRLNATSQYDD